MKELSATEAARNFASLLDAVETRGESFTVVRRGKPIARVVPVRTSTAKDIKALLRRYPPDPEWARELQELRALLTLEERDWSD